MKDENQMENPATARWSGAFFSARYLLIRALMLGIFFLIAHLADLREYTTFLSGTTDDSAVTLKLSAFFGMIYLVLYMGCVVFAPVMILASAMIVSWEKFSKHRQVIASGLSAEN